MLNKLFALFAKSNPEKDAIMDSLVICLGIGNINSITDKLSPQDSLNWVREMNSYFEAEAEKYSGVAVSHNVGEVCLAIPLNSERLRKDSLEILLKNLSKEISHMCEGKAFAGDNLNFGVGVDSGICLISKDEKNLLAGEVVLNANVICRYAITTKEKILVSNRVIEKCEVLKERTTPQGLIPETSIYILKLR